MIARWWQGRIRAEDEEAYAAYVDATGIAALRAAAGNLSARILVRTSEPESEVGVLSFWESMEAIRGFAGPHPERAVYYPEDARYLTHAPEQVEHWEVLDQARVRISTGLGIDAR